jgi:PST family polysaccharide transporter
MKKSIIFLFLVQVANYGIPLVTLPWITRALGPGNYGEMNFMLATVGYFVIFADYGFNLSATKEISVNRDDGLKLSLIFKSVILIKSTICILGSFVLLLFLLIYEKDKNNIFIWMSAYGTVVGSVLTTTWYYQGMERLATLSIITISIRILSLPLIYFYVNSSDNLMAAILISSLVPITSGCISLAILHNEIMWRECHVHFSDVLDRLKNGWHTFLSSVARSLYTTTNVVVLGFIAGSEAVGYFTAAEKIMAVSVVLYSTILQVTYARVGYLMSNDRLKAKSLLHFVLKCTVAINLMIAIVIFFGADFAVEKLYGIKFVPAVFLLQGLCFIPLISGVSNIFGVQTMLNLGLNKDFGRIVVSGGVFNTFILFPLVYLYDATGVVVAFNFTEIFVLILMYKCLSKAGWKFNAK